MVYRHLLRSDYTVNLRSKGGTLGSSNMKRQISVVCDWVALPTLRQLDGVIPREFSQLVYAMATGREIMVSSITDCWVLQAEHLQARALRHLYLLFSCLS
jgi:hypothetical protein